MARCRLLALRYLRIVAMEVGDHQRAVGICFCVKGGDAYDLEIVDYH